MYLKRILLIGALLVGGVVASLSFANTADARPRGYYYRGGSYGRYYAPSYRSYSYRPYYGGYYGRSYYRPSYGYGYGYGYPYRSYNYGGGVYVGPGGVSVRW